jgi:hypothetical protein
MSWWRRTPMADPQRSPPLLTDDGLLYGTEYAGDAAEGARAAYLAQLVDEQYASTGKSGVLISWDQLYGLIGSDAHASSLHLLDVPPITSVVPELESSGVPSDPSFRITISQWVSSATGFSEAGIERQGGCVRVR